MEINHYKNIQEFNPEFRCNFRITAAALSHILR